MLWTQSLPRWVRAAFVAFGLLIVLCGIVAEPNVAVPALVIGLGWAYVGWKGGLPLLTPSASSQVEALGILRRRRFIALLAPFSLVPLVVAIMWLVPHHWVGVAFFVAALLVVFPPLVMFALSACPRCGRHFFLSIGLRQQWPRNCVNCGLPIEGRRAA